MQVQITFYAHTKLPAYFSFKSRAILICLGNAYYFLPQNFSVKYGQPLSCTYHVPNIVICRVDQPSRPYCSKQYHCLGFVDWYFIIPNKERSNVQNHASFFTTTHFSHPVTVQPFAFHAERSTCIPDIKKSYEVIR